MSLAELSMGSIQKFFIHGSIKTTVLRDITIQFIQGNTYALTGVSGTGKSTCIHILAGIETPSSGEVSCNSFNFVLCFCHCGYDSSFISTL